MSIEILKDRKARLQSEIASVYREMDKSAHHHMRSAFRGKIRTLAFKVANVDRQIQELEA